MRLMNVDGAGNEVPDDVIIQDVVVLEEEVEFVSIKHKDPAADDSAEEYEFEWDCRNENIESNKSDKTTVTDSVREDDHHRESSSRSPPFELDIHDVIVASNETDETSITSSAHDVEQNVESATRRMPLRNVSNSTAASTCSGRKTSSSAANYKSESDYSPSSESDNSEDEYVAQSVRKRSAPVKSNRASKRTKK